MSDISFKPIGFARMLDRIFRMYRKLFVPLLQISLLLYGPYYVLQAILVPHQTAIPIWDLINESKAKPFTDPELQTGPFSFLIYFVILLVFALVLIPVSAAAVLRLLGSVERREEYRIGSIVRQAFGRIGPLAGSTVLYGLMIFGIALGALFVIGIVIAILVIVFGASIGLLGGGFDNFRHFGALAVVAIIVYLALLLGLGVFIGFFAIRWGFFIAFVDSRAQGLGFARSWQLTKGCFWRLFGVYLVLYVILAVVSLLPLLIPWYTVQLVVATLVNVALGPLYLVAYAVAWGELQLRKGAGLERMLDLAEGSEAALGTAAAAAPESPEANSHAYGEPASEAPSLESAASERSGTEAASPEPLEKTTPASENEPGRPGRPDGHDRE
ncbi:hypothetical protein [Paenibacillus hamazuiensis]|uniref:hypothetical protein n=1 Tax=Paenibacillus hamazuiensis TaxID=2936508 RepID=UPI00200C4E96|nr:hypothetical protein [Paenibacillus hamazuiensis]